MLLEEKKPPHPNTLTGSPARSLGIKTKEIRQIVIVAPSLEYNMGLKVPVETPVHQFHHHTLPL